MDLKWSDIDMINIELHVKRSLKQVSILSADGTRKRKTIDQIPKTKGSLRTVPILNKLINILKVHRSIQKQERLKLKPYKHSVCKALIMRPEGVEPTTFRFEVCNSIHLSYGRIIN